MNLFEVVLIDFILITFPLILYLFYIAYNQNVGKKENNLIFDITLLTSLYLIIKFGAPSVTHAPLMIANVPLIVAYHKKDRLSIFLLSLLIIVYYYYSFGFNLVFMIFEYFIYYIMYMYLIKNKKSIYNITNIFIIMKAFFITFLLWQINYYTNKSITDILMNVFILSVILFIIVQFVLILLEKGQEILKYHMSIKELEQEKQIKTSLFKITHEIKNPMAVCKGYLDMLDINNTDQTKKYIPIIKEEIDRTLVILQDFLSITKTKIDKDLMDVNMLVEEVANSFKPILKEKNIDFEMDLVDDEIYIYGDYNRLNQVLINVIKNSIESLNKIHSKLKIKSNIINNKFNIIIDDNGVGMNDEVLSKISEPFFTTKKDGTGLGISLSKEILKAHNSSIEYESEENKGTKVKIMIPLEKIKNG